MSENEKTLELLRLLNVDEGDAVGERMMRWAEAFEAWMEERKARVSPKVAKFSIIAWGEFLASTDKPPWEVEAADVEAHLEALEKRKLRPGTLKQRLIGLAKFYDYCQANSIDAECPAGFNPVRQARRQEVKYYEKANYLSQAEEAALLEAARRDPSPMGKRDYALILMLLKTGWKAGQVRMLRWKNLEEWKDWRGEEGIGDKGGASLRLGTEEVWEAVRAYLEATGRWEGIQAEEYVFAPSRDPLVREAGNQAGNWDGSRPICDDQLLHLVRLPAGRAGLKAEKITCGTLRNTAVMRQVEAGASAEEVGSTLGWTRSDNVKAYLRQLAQRPKGRLRARKRIDPATGEMVRPGSKEIPARGPHRGGPRNHHALKHGLYAKYLPELEWLDEEGVELKGMDRAIMRWRIVMRRVMLVGDEARTLEDAMRLLKVMGIASVRLRKALKLKADLKHKQTELRWEAFFRRPTNVDGR